MFVKLIKECTDLGLKDAKERCDTMHSKIGDGVFTEIHIKSGHDENGTPYIKKFTERMKDIDGEYVITGGVQWERNIKMLSLGIGDKSDYVDFIQEYIDCIDRDSSCEIIKKIADKLSIEDLEEIFNEIKIKI